MARSPMASRLPYPPFLWRVLHTTIIAWIGLNFAFAVLLGFPLVFLAALVAVCACALAVWAELRRGSERLFYANMGVHPLLGPGIALVVAGVLEVLLHLVI